MMRRGCGCSLKTARLLKNRALTAKYEETQTRCATTAYFMFRCPCCIEQASGKRFEEWLHSGEEAVLSPCRYTTFTSTTDQPPPLYIDLGEEGHKPKWTLAHGAGPQVLELDRSRSGRLYKPSLGQYGLPSAIYQPAVGREQHAYMIDTTFKALQIASRDEQAAQALAEEVFKHQPLFHHWDALGPHIESIAMDMSGFSLS